MSFFFRRKCSPIAGAAARRRLPTLEMLEDRRVPSLITVTNLHDTGAGSLRQAALQANTDSNADTIRFSAGLAGTITLKTGELSLTHNVNILGPAKHGVTVSGSGKSRAFQIAPGAVVTIANLTITNGLTRTGGGGAILNRGNLTLNSMVLT